LLFAVLCLSFGTTAFASVNPSGTGTEIHFQPAPVIQVGACRVLWFGSDNFAEVPRFQALGLSVTQTTNTADLSAGNLANYDVLIVAYTGPGSIGANQAAIANFVAADNGLLIHQPNIIGAIDYAPAGCGVTIVSECWCGDCNTTNFAGTIVNGAHPITSGLGDADLSGDFDNAANLGANYSVLARNTACASPSLAAASFGTGRVVFETGNASPLAFDPGSDAYWARIFEYLCVGSQTPTFDPTWGRLKVLYR
jgi:hypothetical protein